MRAYLGLRMRRAVVAEWIFSAVWRTRSCSWPHYLPTSVQHPSPPLPSASLRRPTNTQVVDQWERFVVTFSSSLSPALRALCISFSYGVCGHQSAPPKQKISPFLFVCRPPTRLFPSRSFSVFYFLLHFSFALFFFDTYARLARALARRRSTCSYSSSLTSSPLADTSPRSRAAVSTV